MPQRIFSDRLSVGEGIAEAGSRFIQRLNRRRDAEDALRLQDDLARGRTDDQFTRQQKENERLLRQQRERDELLHGRGLEAEGREEQRFLTRRSDEREFQQQAEIAREERGLENLAKKLGIEQLYGVGGFRQSLKNARKGGGAGDFGPFSADKVLSHNTQIAKQFSDLYDRSGQDLEKVATDFGLPLDSDYTDLFNHYRDINSYWPRGDQLELDPEQQRSIWNAHIQDSIQAIGPTATGQELVVKLANSGLTEDQINIAEDEWRRITNTGLETVRASLPATQMGLTRRGIDAETNRGRVSREAGDALQRRSQDLAAVSGPEQMFEMAGDITDDLTRIKLQPGLHPDIVDSITALQQQVNGLRKPNPAQRTVQALGSAGNAVFGAFGVGGPQATTQNIADEALGRSVPVAQALYALGISLSETGTEIENNGLRLGRKLAGELEAAARGLGPAPPLSPLGLARDDVLGRAADVPEGAIVEEAVGTRRNESVLTGAKKAAGRQARSAVIEGANFVTDLNRRVNRR